MKKALISFLVLFTVLQAKSQTYTISPNDTLIVTAPANQLSIFDIYQNNVSGDTLNLAWNLVYSNIQAGWDFSLCDYASCYVGLPSSGTMSPVMSASMGFLGLNINPYSIQGTATVRIYVYDINSPSNGDTLTWIVNSEPSSVSEIREKEILLYPNPADDFLYFSSNYVIKGYSILDQSGRVIQTSSASTVNVPVSSLAPGRYTLVYYGLSGIKYNRSFIKK